MKFPIPAGYMVIGGITGQDDIKLPEYVENLFQKLG